MNCREFLLRYSDYDDSLIPPGEAERFRSHMAECASCARYDRVLRKGRMWARQLRTDPDPDFIPRLRLRLPQDVRRTRVRPASAARLAMGLAAATILMVTGTALLVGAAPTANDLAGSDGGVAVRVPGVGMGEPTDVNGTAGAARPRGITLPPVERVEPRAWAAREVAPAPVSSYSPLETGPPAYRVAASRTTPNFRRALD